MEPRATSTPDPFFYPEEVVYRADNFNAGARLDTFLARHMNWRSRTSIQRLIDEGKVHLDRRGNKALASKGSLMVLFGDHVHVRLPRPKRDLDFGELGPPPDPVLTTLFEDRWLLALDKPPNVPVHPAGRNLYRTVITSLHRRYRRPDDPEHDIVPKLCHRLDLETSGVLLVAKDDRAHRLVSEQMHDRTPEKTYLAIVHGHPERESGTIDLPLGEALQKHIQVKKGVRFDSEGKPSRTEYRAIERRGDFTLLALRLLTGRMHQIRVHCAAIGHPVVGDKIYNGDEMVFARYYDGALTDEDRRRLILPRHALHAHRLQLTHPITELPLDVTAPLPSDLQDFWDGLLESRLPAWPEERDPRLWGFETDD